ncbi:Uncharacterised protein [Burkholderia pseudomallei]|nr:hypothetical protein DP60_2921 [Burkholderia pseudomallei]AJX07415.1 hypothetical protein BBW_2639 [Burkholderia pseudomallei 1026b]CAJ2835045.1 Uncharacterised protein [Burkholderia pseudomallei]CAJ3117178.1 Uncharacterised protein [Burkholderia pseudomallei]CAJ3455695.1 Uncharacterised protein [Burkholderia pseudomallei]
MGARRKTSGMSVRAVAGATARAGAVRFRRRFSVFVGWFCVFSLLAVRRSTLDALFSELCTWHRHRHRHRRWRQYLALGYRHSVPGSRLSADSVRYPTFAVGPLRRTERGHTKICDESNLLRASPMSSRAIASRSGSMRASVTYRRFVSSAPGDIRAKREPGGRAAAAAGTNTGAPSCEWRACDCAPRTPDADRASRGNTRCAAGATRAASR